MKKTVKLIAGILCVALLVPMGIVNAVPTATASLSGPDIVTVGDHATFVLSVENLTAKAAGVEVSFPDSFELVEGKWLQTGSSSNPALEEEESTEKETPKNEATKTESEGDPLEGVPGEAVTVVKGKHNPDGFSVGFARFNITPEESVPLGGFGDYDKRFSENILDQLYLTCTAISDGEETLLLFSSDTVDSGTLVWNVISENIHSELGIPQKNIILNGTHTHSAPSLGNPKVPAYETYYYPMFYDKALACAKTAVADLDKATVKIGRTYADNLNYVRRYLLDDGTYATSPGVDQATPIAHETEADNEMQILYFDRENQKDVVLMNWQSHYAGAVNIDYYGISADWVCGFRRNTETKLNAYAMFIQGAGGNLASSGQLPGEYKTYNDFINHGVLLSNTLIDAIPGLTSVKTDKIQAKTRLFPVTKREGVESWNGANELPISALSFGSVSFATVPYEMIDINGMELKAATPFSMTFVCGYTNGSNSYVPADDCFPNGGYEVNKCHYVQGTAEAVVAELLTMLEDQKENLIAGANLSDFDTTTLKGVMAASGPFDMTGNLFQLTLKAVSPTATGQEVSIKLTARNGNNIVFTSTETKSVQVNDVTANIVLGDANNDGIVNNLDRMVLTRYLAKWEGYDAKNMNLAACDVNNDNIVNNLDRMVLTRHLAKWEGYESLPYVS